MSKSSGKAPPHPTAAIVTHRSANVKLGPKGRTASTYTPLSSCPDSCPLKAPDPVTGRSPCYGTHGCVEAYQLPRMRGFSADEAAVAEAAGIRGIMPKRPLAETGKVGKPLRLHTVGNCSTPERAELVSEAADEYREATGADVWTYTHAYDVPRAAWGLVSVLRSCHTPEQVIQAAADGYAASLVVPVGVKDGTPLPGGFKLKMCPAQRHDAKRDGPADPGMTCYYCPNFKPGQAYCTHDEFLLQHHLVVGFEAHGGGALEALQHAYIPTNPHQYLDISQVTWKEGAQQIRKSRLSPYDFAMQALRSRQ